MDEKERQRIKGRKYYNTHREKILIQAKQYRENHKEKHSVYMHQWNQDHRGYLNNKYAQMRLKVLIHYGGDPPRCVCCGETNIKFLTFDHINGSGTVLRKETGYGKRLIAYLVRHNYPKDIQILCFNCNCGRAINHGICPHKEDDARILPIIQDKTSY